MSGIIPTEKKFEEHIESHLNSVGYSSTDHKEYDNDLCMIKEQVIQFIKTTQPDKWQRLDKIYNADTENKILSRIASEISKRGIIDVLRNEIDERDVSLKLCYFEPKSGMNPEHSELYKSNQFTVVRQLHYSKQNENFSIDMGLFLNGLPIATMELKNQFTKQNIKDAENQYSKRERNEPLLQFKRCMVHFCVDNDKVSMTTRLSGTDTVFLPYNKGITNPAEEENYRIKYFWEEILSPSSFLDIIENFVHISNEKEFSLNPGTQKIASKPKEVLVFPRYHQLELIRNLQRQLKEDGVGKNYLVQHTTGSGKSYSIGWLSHTLASFYQSKDDKKRMFDTIVVVTDRTVLDDQLQNTIRSLGSVEGVVNGVKEDSKELKKFLEQGKDIVITTIQKFPFISKTISSLGHKKFAVIIDEVHSSQSGNLSREMRKSLSQTNDGGEFDYTDEELDCKDKVFDYEEMLRREISRRGPQQHISFFGFTGTPKEKTLEMFGTKTADDQFVPFHIYSMYQSIYEKFTLDVLQNYTTYKQYFKIKQTKGGDIEIPIKEGKRELVKYVNSHEITIRNKVLIMLDHWVNKGSKEIEGKSRGMIVTQSREHCVLYFQEINRQLEERGTSYRCLVGFSDEISIDGKKFSEHSCNSDVKHEGNIPLGLKNPNYRLLVVANKFQTGFDEPLIQSMYIDKKLEGVHCVQTLSRLNRTATGKTQTFVLDFVNESDDIRESFQPFYQSTMLDGETDRNKPYDLRRQIYNFHLYTNEDVKRFCKVFYDPDRNEGKLHSILDPVVDAFNKIDSDDIREDIRSKIQSYIRVYGYLSQITDYSKDIELEETFVFFRYLYKKLPTRLKDQFDISNTVDLDSLRFQKIHERIEELKKEDGRLTPPDPDPPVTQEPEYDYLSEIIKQLNKTHGGGLTEHDRVYLITVRNEMFKDAKVKRYMNGKNTEVNKRNFFRQRLDEILIDHLNDNVEIHKKMAKDSSLRDTIFLTMYDDYQKKAS